MLFLRARWYAPESGTFLSRDAVESEPPYQYVRGNPIRRIDPSGMFPDDLLIDSYGDAMVNAWKQDKWWWNRMQEAQHGDILISRDRQMIAQFVLDDPYLRAYNLPWVPPWQDCVYKKYPIKLEFFTPNGQFHSTTAASFAETWRQNTGSFYYTGLRPGQPTWGEFVPGYNLHSWMRDYQTDALAMYWGRVLPVAGAQNLLNLISTGIDTLSFRNSTVHTVVTDQLAVIPIKAGCSVGPEGCAAGVVVAGAVDGFLSLPSSAVNLLLDLSKMTPTVLSDIVGGQTTIIDGRLRVGEGTVHATLTTIGSALPETHIQLYFNSKQLTYDLSGFYNPVTGSYPPDILDLGIYDITAVELELPW